MRRDGSRWSTSNMWILVLGLLITLVMCLCVCGAAYYLLQPTVDTLLLGLQTPVP
jgi:hypothetical protein